MTILNGQAISLEFFPPRDEAGRKRLVETANTLKSLNPGYVSVTFGAGGTTRDGTLETVEILSGEGFDTAPHLSCIGSSPDDLRRLLDRYRDMGVRRIVALRGDMPSGMGMMGSQDTLRYAVDLVRLIREHSGDWFHIEVAAYPEMHPQASGPQKDLKHFVDKVNAGADGAITQYFFNADAYFDFVDRAQMKGVTIPIIPGIMPITNYAQLIRFSEMCGAEVPRWIRLRLAEMGDDRESIRAFGVDVVTELCQTLLENQVPGLHFYTLNNAQATQAIWQALTT
ncbi:methylenetetrahydrofolate reductase [NAD(P)H] [Orrella sp. 11846]|uniref:methylenetetrahydrofolate reductase [NAD(P)H] n=1 Tax=Orrella sp. 11846 TaxID=3409913 RepID=UPI003B58CA31